MLGQDFSKLKIFIRPGHTDMRKAINGLTALVRKDMKLKPSKGYLFIFCNRRKNILKILFWDKNGFWLFQKTLEVDKFPWVNNGNEKMELTYEKLEWLLKGIDFFKEHKKVTFSEIN